MKSSAVTTFVPGITCILLVLAPRLMPTPFHAPTLTMPTGWIATAEPSGPFEEHSKLMQANYSRHEWQVSVSSGHLEITDHANRDHERAGLVFPPHFHRTKDMIGRSMTARAGSDWLVGFNAGEFGGGLWWASPDGKRTKLLTRENVQAFVRRGKEVLVFTGLAHLSYDRGAVYLFRSTDDDGEITRIADLDSAPSAALLENNGSVLIALSNGVVALRPDGAVVRLYKQEEMPIFYPNSVAGEESNVIFVGCVSMFSGYIVAQTAYSRALGSSDHQKDVTSEKSPLHSSLRFQEPSGFNRHVCKTQQVRSQRERCGPALSLHSTSGT